MCMSMSRMHRFKDEICTGSVCLKKPTVSMGHISSFTREFCNKIISDYTSTINSKGQSAEPVGTGCD